MPDSTTVNYGWAYPTVNADADTWGTTLNAAIIAIDAQMFANEGQPENLSEHHDISADIVYSGDSATLALNNRYAVSASAVGTYSNSNGTAMIPALTLTIYDQNGGTALYVKTVTRHVETGFGAHLPFSFPTVILSRPATNKFRYVFTFANQGGGASSWSGTSEIDINAAGI